MASTVEPAAAEPPPEPAADGEAAAEVPANDGVDGTDDADKGGADGLRDDSTESSTAELEAAAALIQGAAASADPNSADLEAAAALIQGAAASAGPNSADLEPAAALIQGAAVLTCAATLTALQTYNHADERHAARPLAERLAGAETSMHPYFSSLLTF